MSPERMLQQDMFTGDLVDNRTRAQKSQDRKKDLPQQEFLFPQRDLAEPSRQRHFELASTTPLLLRSEDPRTDEEREYDERRAIEATMDPLFAEEAVEAEAQDEESEDEDLTDDKGSAGEREDEKDPANLRRDIYLEIERLSEELAESLWIAPPYDAAYNTQIDIAAAQARSLGLTEYEIGLAMRIGQFRGEKKKAQHAHLTQ